MAKEIIVVLHPNGSVTFEHVGTTGDECLHDLFMQAMKERGQIIDRGFTEDHGKPQPVVYTQRVGAGRR
jgi:hypothetical protein